MTLGIDVGGTNLVFGLVQDGKIVKRVSVPWFPKEATLDETLNTISGQIEEIITPDTEKIGIGVPSVVDVNRGVVYDTVNIPSWTEVPLKEILEARFHLPVAVNNDANCYAMGVYEGYPADAKPVISVKTFSWAGTTKPSTNRRLTTPGPIPPPSKASPPEMGIRSSSSTA